MTTIEIFEHKYSIKIVSGIMPVKSRTMEHKYSIKIVSGIMPVKSRTMDGITSDYNRYAFKYVDNSEYFIFIFELVEPYSIYIGKTISLMRPDAVNELWFEDSTRKFLSFDSIELSDFLTAYMREYEII